MADYTISFQTQEMPEALKVEKCGIRSAQDLILSGWKYFIHHPMTWSVRNKVLILN